jgi:hypothetical protein
MCRKAQTQIAKTTSVLQMSVTKPRIFLNMEIFMSIREFSDIENFQHSGKVIPLFMTRHKNCLLSDYLLGPGPRLLKKEFTVPRSHKV